MKKTVHLIFAVSLLIFNNALAQDLNENPTETEKIFILSKAWKEADKNFVFFDQVPELDWDQAYKDYIPKVLATKTKYDFYKELQKFYALLQDGHTRAHVPWKLRQVYEKTPAIQTELMEGKVYITKVMNDTMAQTGLKKGMEVLKIDGEDVHEYAEKNIAPYVFYSTLQDKAVQVYHHSLLKGHQDSLLKITVSDKGKTKAFEIDRKLGKKKEASEVLEFALLKNNIGHLKIKGFWGDDFQQQYDSIYLKIQKTDKLIIDVSSNLGGNSNLAEYILSHFITEKFEMSRWKSLMYIPAFASWNWNQQWMDNKGSVVQPLEEEKRYIKEVIVLISEKTYSAGEDFVSGFLNTGRGRVIGRPTAGTTGNPIGFELPGGGGIQICSKKDYFSNGVEFVGYGIQPEIEVPQSMDEVLLLVKAQEILGEDRK